MALSVGVTCGITPQFVLDKHPAFSTLGIHALYHKDVCDPLREALDCEGVVLVERVLGEGAIGRLEEPKTISYDCSPFYFIIKPILILYLAYLVVYVDERVGCLLSFDKPPVQGSQSCHSEGILSA